METTSNLFLFKVKHAAYNIARPKDGEPLSLFTKAQEDGAPTCAPGDVVIVYTPHKQPALSACFIVGSVNEGEPASYSVVIEKYDAAREDSHLIRYPGAGGTQEWTNLKKATIQVLYMNGEVISPGILSSSQIDGVTVKIVNNAYTTQLNTDLCILLQGNELEFGEEELSTFKVQKRIDNLGKIHKVRQIISDRTGELIAFDETPNELVFSFNDSSAISAADSGISLLAEPNGASPSPLPSPLYDVNNINNNSNGQSSTKREAEEENEDAATRQNKKIRPSPVPSPADDNTNNTNTNNNNKNTDIATASSSPSSPVSPAAPPPSIDLIKHIAGIAQMVKEMDDEHSDRLTKVEQEVVRIRSILQQHSLFTSSLATTTTTTTATVTPTLMPSPSLPSQSPTVPKEAPKGKKSSAKSHAKGAQKSKSVFSLSDIHVGELIAVRADKTVSPDSYYWMARVCHVNKHALKVKWYEPCEFAPSWYYLDNKEDDVDVETIFLKNFELTLKPCRHPSGHFIDIYKPVTDLKKYDSK